ELQMDEAAAKLGIDPVELRLRNLVGPGEEFMPGKRPLDADLKDDLRCLASSLEWPGTSIGRSIGLGVSASDAGAYPTSTAAVQAFDLPRGDIEDIPGGIRARGRDLSYGEVIEKWFGAGGEVLGHGAVRRAEGFAKMPPFYEIGCTGLELSVDRETGQVHVIK